VRGLFNRAAAIALCGTVVLGGAVAPCAAADAAATRGSKLTKLSLESRQVLATAAPGARSPLAPTPSRRSQGTQTPATDSTGPFFKSTRGKITLALMGAGVGFTIWSINHDRKPVKSPVR